MGPSLPDLPAESALSAWARWSCIGLAIGFFVWNALYFFPYTVDDTFISLRYAHNLVNGHGLVFNPGEQVEGFSNFLWVLVGALILKLGLPVTAAIKSIGVASGALAIFLTYKLGRLLFAGQPSATARSLLGGGLLAINASFAIWAQAGLEAAFLALLLVATVLRFEIELRRERPLPLSALLFALVWMTRPEAPVYGLYFLLRRLGVRETRRWSRFDLHWLLAAACVIVPYEVWGFLYYGALLPNTHTAKVQEAAPGLQAIFEWFSQPLLKNFVLGQGWGFLLLLLLGGVGAFLIGRKRLPAAAWLIPLCGLIFILYARNDWMPRYRFFVPILPFLFLLLGSGLVELLHALRRNRVVMIAGGLLVVASLAGYSWFHLFSGDPVSLRRGKRNVATMERGLWFFDVPEHIHFGNFRQPQEAAALFVVANVPDGEAVCMRDIGFPGYLGMNPIWDTAGLVTPSVARYRRARGEETKKEAMFADLMTVRPAAFWLVLSKARVSPQRRIQEWLESDPEARELYTRVIPAGDPDPRTRFMVYLRNDLVRASLPARLARVEELAPEFLPRLEAVVYSEEFLPFLVNSSVP